MKLQSVQCEGFKAFNSLIDLTLRDITIVFGKNNSGKTTLARLPLFVASSLTSDTRYSLGWNDVSFGGSFEELTSSAGPHASLWIRGQFGDTESLGVKLQRVTNVGANESIQQVSLEIDNVISKKSNQIGDPAMKDAAELAEEMTDETSAVADFRTRQFRSFLDSVIHIPSSRPSIHSAYSIREPVSLNAGEVPHMLAKDTELEDAVDAWFYKNMDGFRIAIDRAGFAFRLVGGVARSINLADSGRGTQSVLPVVTLLLNVLLTELPPSMVIIEEPEEHLHPSAHAAIADLVLDVSRRTQILVETHSENFILRLRRRISEQKFPKDSVSLQYLTEDHVLRPVEIDDSGIAVNWPSGVFETDLEEAQAIMDARLSMINSSELS